MAAATALAVAAGAMLTGAGPAAASANPIQATASVGLTAPEGNSTGPTTLATFTDPNVFGIGQLTATIAWGDGGTSAGDLAQSGATYTVSGAHTYLEEGRIPASVTITDVFNDQAVVSPSIVVADAPLHSGPYPPSRLVAGKPAERVPLAYFTDGNPAGALGDYRAAVNWGDGSPSSAGDVVAVPGGGFAVAGTHTFATSGFRRLTITVLDTGGATILVRERVDVASATSGRIEAHFTGRFAFFHRATEIRALAAHHVPDGATLLIRCFGPGCFRDQAVVVAHRATVKLSGLFHGLILRPGNRIAIQIDKPGLVGEDYVLDIRPDKRPKIQVSSP